MLHLMNFSFHGSKCYVTPQTTHTDFEELDLHFNGQVRDSEYRHATDAGRAAAASDYRRGAASGRT